MHYEITGRGLLVLSILIAALVLGAISVSAALNSGTEPEMPDSPPIDIALMSTPAPTPDEAGALPGNGEGNPTPETIPDDDDPDDNPEIDEAGALPGNMGDKGDPLEAPIPEPIVIPTPTPAPTPAPTPLDDGTQTIQPSEK